MMNRASPKSAMAGSIPGAVEWRWPPAASRFATWHRCEVTETPRSRHRHASREGLRLVEQDKPASYARARPELGALHRVVRENLLTLYRHP